jgi:D-amino-acid dehydrogenase
MKVAVLGAGLAGIPAAYFLAKDGHEVTVVDRQPGAGLETSFANGSLLCLGHSYPWASPAAPRILAKSLIRRDQALRLSPRLDPRLWSWLFKFLRECPRHRADRHAANRLRLASYSQGVQQSLLEDTKIEFSHAAKGLLYIYRSTRSMDEGVKQMKVLERNGLEIRIVTPQEIAGLEPALSPIARQLVGGVLVPGDGTGDAHVFTRTLADRAADIGVAFRYGTAIKGIAVEGGRVTAINTSNGKLVTDAVVVALGSYSPLLLRPLGIKIDVFPVKGYSMTVPIERPNEAPSIGGLDEDNLLAFSVLGDRLRLTATAEFVGYDVSYARDDFRSMTKSAKELFPTVGDYSQAQLWAGLRPATPDGNPLFGATHIPNLFLNTGHGSMGWTMSCGSGKITADLVSNRQPDIDIEDFRFATSKSRSRRSPTPAADDAERRHIVWPP